MTSKDTGNQNAPRDVSSSKDQSNVAKEPNTRFLYGLSKTESSSKMGAEEHTQKMMEAGSFDEAINISSSSAINHFGRRLSKSRSDISGMRKNEKKLERKYSSFDETKYSGAGQAFFDARKANEKLRLIKETSKKGTKSDIDGIEKYNNKKDANTEALLNEERIKSSLDESVRANIDFGIIDALRDKTSQSGPSWEWSVKFKKPER